MKGAKPQMPNVVPMKGTTPRAAPKPPEFLGDEARVVWDHLAGELVSKGRLAPLHEYTFATYCEATANFIAATACLQQEGLYYETKTRNGLQQKKRAAWGIQQESMAAMARIGALFGLSPVDEQRLRDPDQGDLFEQLARQINGTD